MRPELRLVSSESSGSSGSTTPTPSKLARVQRLAALRRLVEDEWYEALREARDEHTLEEIGYYAGMTRQGVRQYLARKSGR